MEVVELVLLRMVRFLKVSKSEDQQDHSEKCLGGKFLIWSQEHGGTALW